MVLDQGGGSIAYRCHARDANLVLSPGARDPIPFRVRLDGETPGPSHGLDVDEDGIGLLRAGGCTSSRGSTTRCAIGRWRSPSSSRAPRRTCSPSASRARTRPTAGSGTPGDRHARYSLRAAKVSEQGAGARGGDRGRGVTPGASGGGRRHHNRQQPRGRCGLEHLLGVSCTYVQTSGGTPVAVSPVDGRVVRWRLKSGSSGNAVTLRVLRPAGMGFAAVASSATETVTQGVNTFVSDLPIKAGDVLGLDNASDGLFFTSAPAISLPLVKYFQPALGPGAMGAPSNQQTNLELLMNADVTPDAGGGTPGGGTPGGGTPGGGTPGGDTPSSRPAISRLRLKPATFPAASSGGSVAHRRTSSGTRVSYRLSVEANVAFRVERRRTGRKKGGKCRLGAHSGGRRCTRYTRLRGGFPLTGSRARTSSGSPDACGAGSSCRAATAWLQRRARTRERVRRCGRSSRSAEVRRRCSPARGPRPARTRRTRRARRNGPGARAAPWRA